MKWLLLWILGMTVIHYSFDDLDYKKEIIKLKNERDAAEYQLKQCKYLLKGS